MTCSFDCCLLSLHLLLSSHDRLFPPPDEMKSESSLAELQDIPPLYIVNATDPRLLLHLPTLLLPLPWTFFTTPFPS